MEKYSKEWKESKGKWIQRHDGIYKIHYIKYDTEYSTGKFFTVAAAREELKNY